MISPISWECQRVNESQRGRYYKCPRAFRNAFNITRELARVRSLTALNKSLGNISLTLNFNKTYWTFFNLLFGNVNEQTRTNLLDISSAQYSKYFEIQFRCMAFETTSDLARVCLHSYNCE